MFSDTSADTDHYNPSLRTLEIDKQESGNCGFDLTRSKWDPYPWVSSVESQSIAHIAGLKAGDCLLEVNGEDIIGQRISDVAHLVKKNSHVTLLLWNIGVDPLCSPEALCCGPMPTNLQRLIACTSSILNILECPICLDTIPPPCYQCDNGHLICVRCKAQSEKCPVCRVRFQKGRSILADHIYNTITDVFGLKDESHDERNAKMNLIFRLKLRNKNKNIPGIKITTAHSNTGKFFNKLNIGKSSSVENLTSEKRRHKSSTLSLDDEFANLKAKSLSSNEISRSTGRINKCGNLRANSFLHTDERLLSLHGSYEFLSDDTAIPSAAPSNTFRQELGDYMCPYEEYCSLMISCSGIIEHFQDIHNGPLIQYFQSPIKLDIIDILGGKQKTYLITIDKRVFVLKTTHLTQERNIRIWMWCLGNKEVTSSYQMSLSVSNAEGIRLLNVQNSIYSLAEVTWKEIKATKKGVTLNEDVINAFNTREIVTEIGIAKL